MSDGGVVLIVIGSFIWAFGFMVVWVEQDRRPLQYLRWTPYVKADWRKEALIIGVRRKSELLPLAEIDLSREDYLAALAEAEAEARARCIALNHTDKAMRRRFPA